MRRSDIFTELRCKRFCVLLGGILLWTVSPASLAEVAETSPGLNQTASPNWQKALQAENRGDWPAAAAEYETFLRAYPDDKAALYHLSTVYLNLGRPTEALATINRLIRFWPSDSQPYIVRAMCYENLQDMDKAAADYTEAIKLEPGATQYTYRAKFWYGRKEYQKAQADYEISLKKDPNVEELYFKLGMAYFRDNQFQKALDTFTSGIDRQVSNKMTAHLLQYRALMHEELSQFETALEDFTQSIKLVNNDPDAYMYRGYLLAKLGHYDQGLQDLSLASALDQTCALCYVYQARIYYQLGLLTPVNNYAALAVRYGPEMYEAYLIRGMGLAVAGHHSEAVSDFDRVIAMRPHQASAYAYRAISRIQLQELADAQKDVQKALQLDPDLPESSMAQARLQMAQNELSRALETINHGLAKNPGEIKLRLCRAEIYYALRQPAAAKPDLQAACDLGLDLPCQLLTKQP